MSEGVWRWVRFHEGDQWQVGRVFDDWVGLTNISGPVPLRNMELGPVVPTPDEIAGLERLKQEIGLLPDGVTHAGAVEVVRLLQERSDGLSSTIEANEENIRRLEARVRKLEDEAEELRERTEAGDSY